MHFFCLKRKTKYAIRRVRENAFFLSTALLLPQEHFEPGVLKSSESVVPFTEQAATACVTHQRFQKVTQRIHK